MELNIITNIETILPSNDSDDGNDDSPSVLDNCVGISYSLEFGELHERDRMKWTEHISVGGNSDDLEGEKHK